MTLPAAPAGVAPEGAPLAGLTMPPGSPDPLSAVVTQLKRWAGELGQGAAGHRHAAAAVVGSSWIGPDAQRCGTSVESIAKGAATLADACDHASSIVGQVQQRWTEALHRWNRAQTLATEAEHDEAAHRRAGASDLSALTQKEIEADPERLAAATAQADGTDGYQSPFRTQAQSLGQSAVTDATHAITVGANALGEIAAVGHLVGADPFAALDAFLATFMDEEVNGLNAAAALPVLGTQVVPWSRWIGFMEAFHNGDFAALAKLGPDEWKDVEAAEHSFGADSPEAIRAQMRYLEELSEKLNEKAAETVAPIGKLPDGTVSKLLDVLGKGALALNVAGDLYGIFGPDQTTLDRGLNSANLAGLALTTEKGTELAGATMELVGLDAATGWIPVAGWVIVGGTALYLGAEWISSHWDEVKGWADAAGHFVTSTVDGGIEQGEQLLGDAGQAVDDGWHGAESGVATATKAVGSLPGKALSGLEGLVSGI